MAVTWRELERVQGLAAAMKKAMSYKALPFELKQVDVETGVFEGYAAYFGNVDAWGDVIERGAFTKTLQENGRRVKICYQHNPMWPIGKPLELREDAQGLYVKGKIAPTELGRDVLILMRENVIDELSIGYDAIKEEWRNGIRYLKEIRLWEISPVTWAANELARITGVKRATQFSDLPLADRERPWDADAAVQRVRQWASSDGSGDKEKIDWAKFRQAFFWYDEDDAENFRAYKLPFADVIDGRLYAVPRGVFAAAAAVMGARGGVDIPEADVPAVKAHIARYYRKMDMEPPWEREESSMELALIETLAFIEAQAAKARAFFAAKEGRVLSAANRELVLRAIEALQALLAAAEPPDEKGRGTRDGKGAAGGTSEPDIGHSLEMLLRELRQAKQAMKGVA